MHVPPDKPENARKVAKLCRDLNLETPSYGSYYRLDGGDFDSVSKTAEILGLSQVQVSRKEKAVLQKMRRVMDG